VLLHGSRGSPSLHRGGGSDLYRCRSRWPPWGPPPQTIFQTLLVQARFLGTSGPMQRARHKDTGIIRSLAASIAARTPPPLALIHIPPLDLSLFTDWSGSPLEPSRMVCPAPPTVCTIERLTRPKFFKRLYPQQGPFFQRSDPSVSGQNRPDLPKLRLHTLKNALAKILLHVFQECIGGLNKLLAISRPKKISDAHLCP
jgi:hypothetical protein